jgi:hypothetical protein
VTDIPTARLRSGNIQHVFSEEYGMNGRLLLLIVAVGLFVRVWEANERGPEAVAAARRAPGHLVLAAKPRLTATPHGPAAIPLPDGIPAGEYRVVDQTGYAGMIEIAPPADKVRREKGDLFVAMQGTRRWYFIRQTSRHDVARPAAPAPRR